MIILGLDPATRRFGYGLVRAEGTLLSLVECGVLSAPDGWDKWRRLAEIGRDLEQVIREHAPDAAAIEAGFLPPEARRSGAVSLDAARGIGGYLCARAGLEVVEYAPSTVKKAVTGSGRAEKGQVARLVQARLGMHRAPEPDAGDALGVAITHAVRLLADRKLAAGAA